LVAALANYPEFASWRDTLHVDDILDSENTHEDVKDFLHTSRVVVFLSLSRV
jgi:hypothetical protein